MAHIRPWAAAEVAKLLAEAGRAMRCLSGQGATQFASASSLRLAPSERFADTQHTALTKGYLSESFFKLTHYPPLTPGTKKEQCSSYVLMSESNDVEDVCGRSRCAGVDYAVCRDDCGLGAADSPTLNGAGERSGVPLKAELQGPPLGKSRMAGARRAFCVDSARPRHHHCGGESAPKGISVPSNGLTIATIHDAGASKAICPTPDSFISTFIRPTRC